MDAQAELTGMVERADALFHDIDLGAVKAWKERTGSRAVGYMPIYVPRELVDAAGMLPVALRGGGDRVEIIRGDAYFQSYICQIPRSTIELALTGRLDCIDGFLFPSICDVIRNMSGMWKLLFPEKYTHYLDVPQNFDPEVGGAFYQRELDELRGDLAALSGREIDDDALRASIERYNENRRALEALGRLRAGTPWKVPAHEAYLIVRAGDVMPVAEHTEFVRRYTVLAAESDRPQRDHTRILVTGAFCEQPPIELVRTLERAGCYLVWDDLTLGASWIQGDIATEGDPLSNLSRAFLTQSTDNASKYDAACTKGQPLCQRVKDTKAEGVVFAAPSFCDPALLDQPMLQKALDDDEVPWTAFRYAENLGQFQVIREQAGTFADSIRLWSEA